MRILRLRVVLVAVLAAVAAPIGRAAQSPLDVPGFKAADFLSATRLWTAQFTFTPEQWAAMQPRYGAGGGGGFGVGGLVGPEGGRNGVAARQGIEFTYVHGDLDIEGHRFSDVAVRYKGNGSYLRARGSDKISLKADLNKHVKGQSLAGLTTLNFQNNITDIGWMNEVLAYRLYGDARAYAPRSSYAKVYVTVSGQFTQRYLGLYSIAENVDEVFTRDRFGVRGGAILKPSTQRPFTDLGTEWSAYRQIYDAKTDLTNAEQARVIEFSNFVSTSSDAEFAARIGDYLDLEAFARYFAVLAWLANADSLLQLGQNYYVYLHPTTHKFTFIAWDQDGSFGNFRGNATSWPIESPWANTNLFLSRVYNVEAFRTQYLDRMREFSRTLFLPARFAAQVADIVPVIRPAVVEEGTQWVPSFDQMANGSSGILPFARARAQFVTTALPQH
ncbi:MAG: CotH kinase family protein [Acidobacteriota bacterium]